MLHGIYWTIISRVLHHSSLYSKPVASPPIRIGVPSNKETNAIQMMTFKFFLNSIFWKLAWEAIYSRTGYCERLNFKMGVSNNKYQHFFLLLSPSHLESTKVKFQFSPDQFLYLNFQLTGHWLFLAPVVEDPNWGREFCLCCVLWTRTFSHLDLQTDRPGPSWRGQRKDLLVWQKRQNPLWGNFLSACKTDFTTIRLNIQYTSAHTILNAVKENDNHENFVRENNNY